MASKVKFNIHDVYYAPRTVSGGTVTYSTPVALPGAVSISLEAQGDRSPFYADGIEYFVSQANTGYQGDLVVAMLPDAFRTAILGEIVDSKKVQFEDADVEPGTFALSFTVDGDAESTKFWFYNCICSRPATATTTNTESKEPHTDTLTITARPELTTGYVRAKTTALTADADLAAWNSAVYAYTP